MKKMSIILLCCIAASSYSQNVGIGTRSPLSKLHVAGDLRIDSLSNKDSGVVIHNTSGVLTSLKFTGKNSDVLRGDGTFQSLNAVAASSPYWLTTGNAETDTSINFIGTTDNKPLRFRINNSNSGRIESSNVGLGLHSLQSLTTGNTLIAIGQNALYSNTDGYNNIAIGNNALYYSVGGRTNVYGTIRNIGVNNVGIGTAALYWNTVGEHNTAVGHYALQNNTWGERNTAMGHTALASNTYGNANTAFGFEALFSNTGTAALNVALGAYALRNSIYGYWNTALGAYTLNLNKTGGWNTAVGVSALFSTQSSNQTAVGAWSMQRNTTGEQNTAIGYKSLYNNTTGSSNVASGYQAMIENITGSSNVAMGYQSLFNNKDGVSNTAAGTRALSNNNSGVNNAALGYGALNTNTTGFQNTGIGMYADVTAGNFFNATAIGYNAKVNASNKVRIGNAAVTKIEGQVPFSTPSDGRYKYNVREDVRGLSFIMRLRPVTYQFDVKRFDGNPNSQDVDHVTYDEAQQLRRTGFIAQEVERAADESNYAFNGINKPQSAEDHYSLSYESFVVPLVKAVQEQQAIINNMNYKLNSLAGELKTQEQINKDLSKKIDELQSQINTIRSQSK